MLSLLTARPVLSCHQPQGGEYIITENLVENTGDGCIAMNNNAFGTGEAAAGSCSPNGEQPLLQL